MYHDPLGIAGIIPADAGNTEWELFFWHTSGDHPRGCGEHIFPYSNAIAQRGSSPRMRGTLQEGAKDYE